MSRRRRWRSHVQPALEPSEQGSKACRRGSREVFGNGGNAHAWRAREIVPLTTDPPPRSTVAPPATLSARGRDFTADRTGLKCALGGVFGGRLGRRVARSSALTEEDENTGRKPAVRLSGMDETLRRGGSARPAAGDRPAAVVGGRYAGFLVLGPSSLVPSRRLDGRPAVPRSLHV